MAALKGAIAFMREDGPDHWQLWQACADLTEPKQLTPDGEHQSGWPVFSPDGSTIAFNSTRDDPNLTDGEDVWDIYTMPVGGGVISKLITSTDVRLDPAYSHDGTRIAFGWDAPGKRGIWVVSVDGTHTRRISTLEDGGGTDIGPRFSPDDRRIVFTRVVGDSESALFVVGIDGGEPIRISPSNIIAAEADWSPDGTKIAVHAESAGFPRQTIWVMAPDGAGAINLNHASIEPGIDYGFADPVWAPDGSLLMLEWGRFRDGQALTLGLARMRPDGTDLQYVGDGSGAEDKSDWTGSGC